MVTYCTDRVIDSYVDVFGNNIDVYEEKCRYCVGWEDCGEWVEYECEDEKSAWDLYYVHEGENARLYDNQYDITYYKGEWY